MVSKVKKPTPLDEYIQAAPKEVQKKLREMRDCIREVIQFPLDKPLPIALIEKITKFRVKETLEEDAKWRP